MRFMLAAMVMLAGCAGDPPPQASSTPLPFARTVTLPSVRPQLEPGRVFAGNDQAVLAQLRDLVARPESESATVAVELETYGLDRLAPMVLVEYARRLKLTGKTDWRYWYEVGQLRAKFDQRACKDATARQFITVAMMEYQAALEEHHDTSAFFTATGADEDERFRILRRVIDAGTGFNGQASAWWICSHGMAAMTSSMTGRSLSLNDWWTGEAALKEARAQAEAALTDALKEKGL